MVNRKNIKLKTSFVNNEWHIVALQIRKSQGTLHMAQCAILKHGAPLPTHKNMFISKMIP